MYYSYVMGIDNSIFELEKEGFIIENDGENYMVKIPNKKVEMWEEFIKKTLEIDYWNEYIKEDKAIFIFRLKEEIKRFEVEKFENDEVLGLCERLCECKFVSIKKMLSENHFYNKYIFKY